jgi:transcriptional regulator GlxA family with amidase domain
VRRRVILLVYDGFELLDLSGPASVFGGATHELGDAYRVVVVSPNGGEVMSTSRVTVGSGSLRSVRVGARDTLLVVGGPEPALVKMAADVATLRWLEASAQRAERFGSVCSGTFILAAANLLDGRRAATHWGGCDRLAQLYPNLSVDPEALYVRDGRVWTSAGVTTGIDMALAMVEADHGAELTKRVARLLVVSVHRPGHQSQFSASLEAQKAKGGDFSDLIAWIDAHLSDRITVGALAERVHMSERTFHRRFKAAVGVTPSRWVERAKMEEARRLLEEGERVKQVAASVGFSSQAAFRTAFEGRFGLAPSVYRAQNPTQPSHP